MVDKNNVPLKEGDKVKAICPFCGWTDWGERFEKEKTRKWVKCIMCKKKYKPRSTDFEIYI